MDFTCAALFKTEACDLRRIDMGERNCGGVHVLGPDWISVEMAAVIGPDTVQLQIGKGNLTVRG